MTGRAVLNGKKISSDTSSGSSVFSIDRADRSVLYLARMKIPLVTGETFPNQEVFISSVCPLLA